MVRRSLLAVVAVCAVASAVAPWRVVSLGMPGRRPVSGVISGAEQPGGRLARVSSVQPSGPARPVTVVQYSSPVDPLVVLRRFAPPRAAYGPGHLGVDLRSRPGGPVTAAADGTVIFSGQVAGRGVVVVAHSDGISTEYEPVDPTVRRGTSVRSGQLIGRTDGLHRGCSGSCLHWGARRGHVYLDPLTLLRPLGIVRLLPSRS